ncbi:DUF6223 family protein [Streptomyces sp. NPDC053755]|uniref:DUF6223 family protein n=1 Tax=Streptomyces sp. NPDC053755 TaxID=3155815 RepID=UPI003436C009
MPVRFGPAVSDSAHVAFPPLAADVLAMSGGRLGSLLAGLVGLAGVAAGTWALRSAGRTTAGFARSRAVVALVAGAIAMALGALVVATSDTGIGTGNGRGGAFVALAVGLTSLVLGGLARTRSRVPR